MNGKPTDPADEPEKPAVPPAELRRWHDKPAQTGYTVAGMKSRFTRPVLQLANPTKRRGT
jgi:hypothetical protein